MNLSELSGQQPIDRKGRDTSLEEDLLSLDSVGRTQVFCSDPDFIRSAKSAGRTNQCHPMVNQRGSGGSSEQKDMMARSATNKDSHKIKNESTCSTPRKSSSSQYSRRSRLAPPQVKRSSSMTRLTEVVHQIHNICVFPAHPLTSAEVSSNGNFSNFQKVNFFFLFIYICLIFSPSITHEDVER